VDHFDVIIIGTGAGGGTLAHALAPTGKRILLLERGDFVRREKANWDPRQVNVEGRYQTKEVWSDRDGKPLHPHTNYAVGSGRRISASCDTMVACRRPGRSPTRSSSRTT
jgi:choline dehydrogenase-like flavoprotein